MSVSPTNLWDRWTDVAKQAAEAAREVHRAEGAGYGSVSHKDDGSEVTDVDHAVEQAIRRLLKRQTPSVPVIGEEFGGDATGDRFWVVDPIDGTISFTRGIPGWSTLIALIDGGEPVVSVVDIPVLDWTFSAQAGGGCYLNDQPVRAMRTFDARADVVCHGDLYTFESVGLAQWYDGLASSATLWRSYTDAFGHGLVARGSAALVVDAAMELWDYAAVALLHGEAGARVWERPAENSHLRSMIAGSSPAVEWALSMLPS